MSVEVNGSRVAIVGGSIAGCAAAIALLRSGCTVTVYERTNQFLEDRGYGIGIPTPVRERLVEAGYLDADTPVLTCDDRLWLVRDPVAVGGLGFGRIAWRQPFPAALNNWGVLWRALRSHVPDQSYRAATTVTEIHPDDAGVTIVTGSGERARYDIVVGADGYRSMTRPLVDPKARPRYAGYSLWRGNYHESRLPTPVPGELDRDATTVCFPHGHAIFYLIPDFTAGRRINWAVYLAIPHGQRFRDPTSVPPGSVGADLLTRFDRVLRYFPDYWADVIRATDRTELSLQPVYDASVRGYVTDRLLLIGDAATLARPHTGSGATKALQDALALARVCAEHRTWDRVLAAYDGERRPAGNRLVALGQRLGAAQVLHTPHWQAMTPATFQSWMFESLHGLDHPYDR